MHKYGACNFVLKQGQEASKEIKHMPWLNSFTLKNEQFRISILSNFFFYFQTICVNNATGHPTYEVLLFMISCACTWGKAFSQILLLPKYILVKYSSEPIQTFTVMMTRLINETKTVTHSYNTTMHHLLTSTKMYSLRLFN